MCDFHIILTMIYDIANISMSVQFVICDLALPK